MSRRIAVLLAVAGLLTVAMETAAFAAPASRSVTISSAFGRSCTLNISGSNGAMNTSGYSTRYGLAVSCNATMYRGWGHANIRYTCTSLSLSCSQSGPNCDMTGRSWCDSSTSSSRHLLAGFTLSTGTGAWPMSGMTLELPQDGDRWTSFPDYWNYKTKWACASDTGFGADHIACDTEIAGS